MALVAKPKKDGIKAGKNKEKSGILICADYLQIIAMISELVLGRFLLNYIVNILVGSKMCV
jgi:hypothetical protein